MHHFPNYLFIYYLSIGASNIGKGYIKFEAANYSFISFPRPSKDCREARVWEIS